MEGQVNPQAPQPSSYPGSPGSDPRELAIKRIKDRNDFKMDVVAYVTVNALLVVIWAVMGAGFFWPVFLIAAWGVGLILHAYTVFRVKEITEEQIQREMAKRR